MQTKIMRAQSKAATSDQLLQHPPSQTIPAIMHDRSHNFGILVSIESIEEDSIIANFRMETRGKHQTVTMDTAILLSTDYLLQLKPLRGQRVGLACFGDRVHIRPLEEPHKAPLLAAVEEIRHDLPRKKKSPVLEAVEQIRADLPNKRVEVDYNGDLPAIMAALQEGPRRVVEVAMICNLSDEAARRRLKVLVDSGTVEHEKITRIVNKRSYEFDTKRWQLVKTKIGEICNDCEGKIAAK